MRKLMVALLMMAAGSTVFAQTYDSTTKVDTNNTSSSTSTVTSTNTNNNTNTNTNNTTVNSTATNNNNNVNTSTSTNTNNNNNVNTSTSTNVNTNNNINSGEQTFNNNNNTTSNNTNTNNNNNTSTSTNTNVNKNENSGTVTNINKNETEVRQISPPPTAVAPTMMSGGNSDLCTVGTSGAVQTQILGVSSGGVLRDKNCERLKNAKVLYDMGMKVAAVATLCQDRRVFDAMWNAGTPCPFEGEIGAKARAAWEQFPERKPAYEEDESDPFYKKTLFATILGYLLFIGL